jgi:Raf kinase inhibitor-like YbhB/YbcL family protein
MTFTLTSPVFDKNGSIPTEYTCDGAGTPPPLTWTGAPSGTRSFALIVEDPDAPDPAAPKRILVHWVAYDIPSSATTVDGNYREGSNDRGGQGYTGPCPPVGRHRYFFRLYALDSELGDLGDATKGDVEQAMKGHVLARAELVGTYEHATVGTP